MEGIKSAGVAASGGNAGLAKNLMQRLQRDNPFYFASSINLNYYEATLERILMKFTQILLALLGGI